MSQGMTPAIRHPDKSERRDFELARAMEFELEVGRAWGYIRRNWPNLSGEDKLAWNYLFRRSRCGREIIDVKASELGADQGVTSDAGLTRIKNLIKAGLIEVKSRLKNDKSGVYTTTVLNPFDVGRSRAIAWDGQIEFSFMEEMESPQVISGSVGTPADCAPACVAVPKRRSVGEEVRGTSGGSSGGTSAPNPSNPSEKRISITSFSFENLSNKERFEGKERVFDRGTSGGSSAPSADRNSTRPLSSESEIEYLAKRIRTRVACKNLRFSPCLKAAQAVFDGTISRDSLERLLERIEAMHRDRAFRGPPSVYFNFSLNRLLEKSKPK